MRTLSLFLSAVAAGLCLSSSVAEAATCGSLTLDNDAQEVIIGEYGQINYMYPMGEWIAPSYTLGVCWRDVDDSWHIERIDGCDSSTPAGDVFLLQTRGGDDYVATLQDEDTYDWLSPDAVFAGVDEWGVQTRGFACEGSAAVAPWHDGFAFGVFAQMGTGADEFHGTPNDDVVHSNAVYTKRIPIPAPYGPLTTVPQAPADGALDLLCGAGGDDTLLGDADDDYMGGVEEWLDGGSGYDICDGDPPHWSVPAGNSTSDLATTSCEDVERAYSSNAYFDCSDTSNPVFYLDL